MNNVSIGATRNLVVNNVLKNTFMLLAATFGFSVLMALASISLSLPFMGPWITLGVYIGILVLLHMNANNGFGVALCFALTGWLGLSIAPTVTAILAISPMVVVSALTMSTLMFLSLSFYAIVSGKNFSYMGGFLMVGTLIAFVAGIIAMVFSLPLLSLLVSAAFVILSGGIILWQVGEIVNGGETNYVLATVTLFVSFYNIFASLLQLFGYNND